MHILAVGLLTKWHINFFFYILAMLRGMWIPIPQPGIKFTPNALAVQSFNHWTTREVSVYVSLIITNCLPKGLYSFTFPPTVCNPIDREAW